MTNSSPDSHLDRPGLPASLWRRLSRRGRRPAEEQAVAVHAFEYERASLQALRPPTPQLLDQLTRVRAALQDRDHERFRRACHGYLLNTLARTTRSSAGSLDPDTAARVDWAHRYLGEHDLAAAAALEQAAGAEPPGGPDDRTVSAAADTFIAPAGGPAAEARATLQTVLDELVAEARRLYPGRAGEDVAVVVYSRAAELVERRGGASLVSWLGRDDREHRESTTTVPVDLDEVIAAQPGQQPAPPTAAGPNG